MQNHQLNIILPVRVLYRSATTLKPQTSKANNNDYLVIVQCSALGPWKHVDVILTHTTFSGLHVYMFIILNQVHPLTTQNGGTRSEQI